ncbi:putative ATP-dependent helicase IRC3 [Saxophila tyrrhenica]|uniref:ATP-dependent helicase IRC3 n=1 Tax=Saxophila tyrrhenica TaxID=1690608 RepID=A0AAV9PQH0_9PEZI|nr:putative ATP-dependent helicase IRC3 [Saxophila tyrrhenica]
MRPLVHGLRVLRSSPRIAGALSGLQRYAIRASRVRWFSKETPRWRADTSQIQLRPYQDDCIESVLQYLKNGSKRLGVSLATGSGKTVVFSHLIDAVPPPNQDATQTLILAHRRELIEQAAQTCRNIYPDKIVDVEMADMHATGLADITVASVQSITSGDRLSRYDPRRFKLVLVDETHHIVASTYHTVLEYFGLATKEDAERGVTALVGVSATFSRADGLSLGAAIDHIVYHMDYIDMIEGDWLAPLRFTTVQSGVNLSTVKSTETGDYQTGQLVKVVNTPEINEITVRSWLAIAEGRKSTLAFCVDLNHVAALSSTFRAHGIDAQYVTGLTRKKQRAEILAAFKAGELPVLINCGLYTEGTDIPNIDCVILARPTKSRNLLIQMVGRGLRKSPGKEDCHIIDMVASLDKGIVTTPTLFGLDPHEIVEDATASTLKELKSRRERGLEMEAAAKAAFENASGGSSFDGNITFTHFDVNSLVESTSGERHIRGLSRLAWVQVDSSRYILSDKTGSYLTLSKQEDDYVVKFTQILRGHVKGKSPYMRPRDIVSTPTLEHAINAADTYAKKHFLRAVIALSAPWRGMDATPQQIVHLNKFRAEDKKLEPGSITKGRAADWITKLKHGATKVAKRLQAEKAQEEKEEKKRSGKAAPAWWKN